MNPYFDELEVSHVPFFQTVGLMVNEEALNFLPARHYSAYVLGLFPSIYDWVVNVSNMSPLQDPDTGGNLNLTGLPQWFGVLAWKRGALLISFLWVAMLVMVIDRKWKLAMIWALIASLFAAVGIIHVPEAGFKNFSTPTWEQCVSYPDECWEYAQQWMFFVAYLMLATTFGIIEVARRMGLDKTLLPELEDEAAHAFDDWFADADKVVHMHTHTPGEDEEEISVTKEMDHASELDPTMATGASHPPPEVEEVVVPKVAEIQEETNVALNDEYDGSYKA